MRAPSRFPLLPAAALLLAGACSQALAESPLIPDPVAPAVIGRPLDQIRPARPARARPVRKHAAAKPKPAREAVAAKEARPAVAMGAGAATALPVAAAPAAPRAAKQALDDRADTHFQAGEVGKGTHFARKPLGEGAYFGDRHRQAAYKYYEEHPVKRPSVNWKIGEPVPRDAVVALVPNALLAVLPKVPPGHRYVELGGDVVLIAAQSKMVVDGISRRR
jgi:hypothetical protein